MRIFDLIKEEILMGVRHMQGVPAQLETLKAKGKRRHPSYCIYHKGTGKNRICSNPQSFMYSLNCHSAARCEQYVANNES